MLPGLHAQIDACQVCIGRLAGVQKPAPLDRGDVAQVVVVGEAPGNTELTSGRAFSGQAGKRLEDWLRQCGFEDPRTSAYLTAAVKCVPDDKGQLPKMATHCRHFLHGQLAAIRPKLVITLGTFAYGELAFDGTDYGDALCHLFDSRDFFLVPPVGFHFSLMPWPHPSGLNRWHNNPANRARLHASFDSIRGLGLDP